MAEVKGWEKSVWKQQFFQDYETFIGAVLILKDHLEEGKGMNPYDHHWWGKLQGITDMISHHQRVLSVTRSHFLEAHPKEETIPFGHFPVRVE